MLCGCILRLMQPGIRSLLRARMDLNQMSPYLLFKRITIQGGSLSQAYIDRILKGTVNQVSVEKLRLLAKAFNDPIEVWLEAAGYLEGISSVEAAIEQRYGPLFKDAKMAAILTKKGVIEILEVLATVPDEKMAGLAEFIKTYAKGLQ